MSRTRDFKESVAAGVQGEPVFAQASLDAATTLFVSGERDLAKSILRDLVNATMCFEPLGLQQAYLAKNLHRMLLPLGNPKKSRNSASVAAVVRSADLQLKRLTCLA